MRRTPQLAVCFLDDLGQTELAGDLAEELSAGRSRWWLWWQVGAAIVAALFDTIRRRPYRTLSAVAVGWTTLIVVELFFLAFLVPRPASVRHALSFWLAQKAFALAWHAAEFFVTGWVVARVHRQHRLALVLVTMLSIALTNAIFMGYWFWRFHVLGTPQVYLALIGRMTVLNNAQSLFLALLGVVGGWFPGTGNAAGDRRARALGEAHGDEDAASAVDHRGGEES